MTFCRDDKNKILIELSGREEGMDGEEKHEDKEFVRPWTIKIIGTIWPFREMTKIKSYIRLR